MATATPDMTVETQMGKLRVMFVDFAFDSSYPTGGETFNEDTIGSKYFKNIVGVSVVGYNDTADAGYIVAWNTADKKLQAWYPSGDGTANAAGAEVGNTDDLSALSVRLMVVGI